MKPLPPRLPSASAKWAFRFAAFSPFLGLISIFAHRASFIDGPSFTILFWTTLALTLFALFLTALAFRALWTRGKRGGRQASWALFFITLVLLPYGWMLGQQSAFPQQTDVTTDLILPPVFLEELRTISGDARVIVAAELRDGYPELEGQRFRADMETVYAAMEQVALDNGMTVRERRGRIGANDEVFLELEWYSPIVRWPHEALLRLTDEGDTSFVDIRSRSIDGVHDRGANYSKILKIQSDLDFALIGAAGS